MKASTQDSFVVERIDHVFAHIPTLIASALVGVFLVFVFLYEIVGDRVIMAWVTFMLSTLAARGWLWQAHRSAAPTAGSARRWEYANAFFAFLMGLGWGALGGPLFPQHDMGATHFVMLLTAAVAFTAAVHNSLSPLSFAAVLIPTLLPIGIRLAMEARSPVDGATLSVLMVFGVILMLQRSQYRIVMDNLRRRVESETLLEEQEAIFQSASQGIAVVSGGHIAKCNHRLGEMLGRRLQDLYALGFAEHFIDKTEFDRTIHDSQLAFGHGRNYHAIARLCRVDGSEFWAELSARRMHGEDESRSVWIIADVTQTSRSGQDAPLG
ncbi:MAG: PAS domain S-box protein [Gammaproteobacteria bacterium]|nr:PAS domain S-box protein [Gammaproteobacteria bacterium]MBU1645350.1 PAS domain S-box protein [Gammaproteobacteria bacterium]MBU1972343.1 PAS domain S-box protein [Gammaproteobacteria bacterium]